MSDKCCTPFIEGEGCSSALQKKASNVASGDFSTAVGHGTIASNEGELSAGKYNQSNAGQLFSVGIGTSDSNRKNALQVNADGSTSVLYNDQLVPLGEFITHINETSGNRIRMGIVDGCIKVSYDSGQTWETVIALSELHGPQGEPGAGVLGVTAGIGVNNGGSPSVTATFTDGILNFVFNNLGGGSGGFELTPATQYNLGGIKIGYTEVEDSDNYAVKLDENSKAYVTVPVSTGTPGQNGQDGQDGEDGEDGVSVTDMKYLFKGGDSASFMELPSSSTYSTISALANIGWVENSNTITLTSSIPYLWCFLRIAYSDGTVSHVGPWCVRYLNQELNIDYEEIAERVINQIDSDLADIKSRLSAIDGPNSDFVHENGLTSILNSYIRYDSAGNGVATFRGFADAIFNAEEASIKASAGSELVDRLAGAGLTISGIAAALLAAATKQELSGAISDARTEWRTDDDALKAAITSTVTKGQYVWYDKSTGDIYEYNHFNKTANENFAEYEARVIALFGQDQSNNNIVELRLIADQMSVIKQESDSILLAVGDGTNVSAGIQILKDATWRDHNGNVVNNPNGTPATGSKIILDASRVEINGQLSAGIISANAAAIKSLAAEQIAATNISVDTLTTEGGNNSSIVIDDGLITIRDSSGKTRIIIGQGTGDSVPVLKFFDSDGTAASGSTPEVLGTELYDLGPNGLTQLDATYAVARFVTCRFWHFSSPISVGDRVVSMPRADAPHDYGSSADYPDTSRYWYKYTDAMRVVWLTQSNSAVQYQNPDTGDYSSNNTKYNNRYFLDTDFSYNAPDGDYVIDYNLWTQGSGTYTANAVVLRITTVGGVKKYYYGTMVVSFTADDITYGGYSGTVQSIDVNTLFE